MRSMTTHARCKTDCASSTGRYDAPCARTCAQDRPDGGGVAKALTVAIPLACDVSGPPYGLLELYVISPRPKKPPIASFEPVLLLAVLLRTIYAQVMNTLCSFGCGM